MHSIERIAIFSLWTGFADPPAHAAKLVVMRRGARFVRERLPERTIDEVPAVLVTGLEEALARPVVPRLDPAMFDLPEPILRAHYDTMWTDDYPAHLVEIRFSGGQSVTIRTDDQHAFMLPLTLTEVRPVHATGGGQARAETAADNREGRRGAPPSPQLRRGRASRSEPARASPMTEPAVETTFDPRLSLAIAMLMPDGYLQRDRLAGKSGMLVENLPDLERREAPIEEPRAPDPAVASVAESAGRREDVMQEIYRVLSREESPEEIAAAERAGKLSERLLKRISAADARDLLARGANANIADDVGQTALMHAAFPPFNRELFRLLVQSGASLEARRRDGFTGLHLACAGGEGEAAEEWVRAGADASSRLPDGTTPLMLGATWPRIVRSLLAVGAEVNAADDHGHTPLVYAIARQSSVDGERMLSALRELLDAGADVNRPDRDGVTPQEQARRALARVELEEEVFRAFHPDTDASRGQMPSAVRMAETIVDLVSEGNPEA